jgi:hypothetical protein
MIEWTGDQIGRLAELIAARDLSRPVKGRFGRPLFRAAPLGEKYPTVDFLVDLLDREDGSIGFFFVQVKGSASGRTVARLPIDVPIDRYNRLVRLPAPTFVIGVDVVEETSYLVAAHKKRKARVSSITRAYGLNDDGIKIRLYKEVLLFWRTNRPILRRTQLRDV